MAIRKLASMDEIDIAVWRRYGLCFGKGETVYRIMNYVFTRQDVREVVDFGDLIEIETDKAYVKVGKNRLVLEIKYKVDVREVIKRKMAERRQKIIEYNNDPWRYDEMGSVMLGEKIERCKKDIEVMEEILEEAKE